MSGEISNKVAHTWYIKMTRQNQNTFKIFIIVVPVFLMSNIEKKDLKRKCVLVQYSLETIFMCANRGMCGNRYRQVPKFSDARKPSCNQPKFKQRC